MGLCLERSPELVVGLLGILKAGGAYVPLDPDLPAGAAAPSCWTTRGARCCVTQARWLAALPADGAAVVCLDADAEPIARGRRTTAGRGAAPDDLAYVIYTSGSTGRPKGVAVAAPRRACAWCVETRTTRASARTRSSCSSRRSPSTPRRLEIWGAAAQRRPRWCCRRRTRSSLDGARRGARATHGVTTLWLTAGLFHQMVDEPARGACAGVRQLLAGGDVLSPPHVRRRCSSAARAPR